MSFVRFIPLLAALLAASADAQVSAAFDRPFWRQAFAAAWQRHPAAAGLPAKERAAQAAREAAEALTPEPASIAIGTRNDRFGRRLGQQEYEIELAAPLWLPGQRQARQEEAAAQHKLLAAQREVKRLVLAGELREALWALAVARQAVTLTEKRLASARQLEADVRHRYEVGELSRIDANLAQVESHTAETAFLDAQKEFVTAEKAWQLLTGLAAPAEFVVESLAQAGGVTNHPLVLEAEAQLTLSKARFSLASKSQRASPELALRVVRERGNFAEAFNDTLGIRLKIPFSSEPLTNREAVAAQAEVDSTAATLLRLRQQIEREIAMSRQALALTERQLELARQNQRLAAENLRLAEKAFALGESDLATLLRIRAAAFDADAFLDRQRVARAAAISRLNQAMGVLP